MFDIFNRRKAAKKPQLSSHYSLFSALCRFGTASVYTPAQTETLPPMTVANISVLSNGNIILYDENAERVLEFFTVQEIAQATRDFEKPEQETLVSMRTKAKKIFLSFDTMKDKNIFWTVLNYAREHAAPQSL